MFPKSMYKQTKDGMVEELALSFDEMWSMAKEGWHMHPQEARLSPEVEVVAAVQEKHKPGRKKKC